MSTLTMVRQAYFPDCTLGAMSVAGRTLHTLELPWQSNHHSTSCIPIGIFGLAWFDSELHGRVLRLSGVPDREGIEVHIGNRPDETRGCILVGTELVVVEGRFSLFGSGPAMSWLREKLILEPMSVLDLFNVSGGVL